VSGRFSLAACRWEQVSEPLAALGAERSWRAAEGNFNTGRKKKKQLWMMVVSAMPWWLVFLQGASYGFWVFAYSTISTLVK